MAGRSLTFHLPTEAALSNILMLIDGLCRAGEQEWPSRPALLSAAAETHDVPQRNEIVDFSQRLGLITAETPFRLSRSAHILHHYAEPVARDVLHFMAYSAWSADNPAAQVPFWSYSHTVDLLWNSDRVALKEAMSALVEDVVGDSRNVFVDVDGYNPEKVSYSLKSVRGILLWLGALDPPVLIEGVLRRRQTCSAELIALALGLAARQAGIGTGNDLLLSQERREAVCRICLLEPGYLDRLLDWAIPRFPELLAPGMRGGSYGRSVRLLRIPAVEDLAQGRKYP